MFHSIKDSWLSASKNNMADVKELVPEFFYLPDFLLNTNKFDLGMIYWNLIIWTFFLYREKTKWFSFK